MFIYVWRRERAWAGEEQRERETQNRKQAPGSEPSAQSLTRGSNPRTVRSWPGWSRTLNRLRHPGAPTFIHFWEMERDRAWAGEGQRERQTIIRSRLQPLSCQHRAWRGARTCEPRDHDLSQNGKLNRLSHAGAPWGYSLNTDLYSGS